MDRPLPGSRIMTATFSLEESAALICGADHNGNPLPGKTQWLMKRLRTGELIGYKCGRQWRMTDEQIADAIQKLTPQRARVPQVPTLAGLTRTSRRRLAS
jgi:hypothetical protein